MRSEELSNAAKFYCVWENLKFSAPHYYLTIEVDMDYCQDFKRKQINKLARDSQGFL